MGANKQYINISTIKCAWTINGAEGISNLYTMSETIIMCDNESRYIGEIMEKQLTIEDKRHLIHIYIDAYLFENNSTK